MWAHCLRFLSSLAMRPAARCILLLAWSLAFLPGFAVSWEINLSDLQEKDVNQFSSNGFQCPTCLAVKGRECDNELKWCAADKLKCFEFSGIIKTGINNISIEMKKCIQADLCEEALTSYLGLPIINKTGNCRPALRSGACVQPPARILLFLFLGKLLR
uniref:Uncharacterized LOC106148266 n=2 Tax=Chinchilla lanigera TaxID=34839 RepID=A0A8C2YLU5_CHILA